MNNPSFGLLGGGQPPGGPPGLLGQPMPQQPMMDPAMLSGLQPPGAEPQAPPPDCGQIDPMMVQALLAAMEQQAAPQMPAQPQPQPMQAPAQPQPEPFNGLPSQGNSIADEYIARLQMNPALGPMLGGIAPMPGYDPQQAFANWQAGINQPQGQPLPHPAYKGPGYGEQLRMEGARAQADEAMRSASRI
jgi:hypothetical protein